MLFPDREKLLRADAEFMILQDFITMAIEKLAQIVASEERDVVEILRAPKERAAQAEIFEIQD